MFRSKNLAVCFSPVKPWDANTEANSHKYRLKIPLLVRKIKILKFACGIRLKTEYYSIGDHLALCLYLHFLFHQHEFVIGAALPAVWKMCHRKSPKTLRDAPQKCTHDAHLHSTRDTEIKQRNESKFILKFIFIEKIIEGASIS